jgi:hypothetical protein
MAIARPSVAERIVKPGAPAIVLKGLARNAVPFNRPEG